MMREVVVVVVLGPHCDRYSPSGVICLDSRPESIMRLSGEGGIEFEA